MTTLSTPRIVLITGASRGLGRSAALHCARSGMDVIVTYRSQAEQAQSVVDAITNLGQRAMALPLDVMDSASFPTFAEQVRTALRTHWQVEQLNALVNNAGEGQQSGVMETSAAQMDAMYAMQFKAPWLLAQALQQLLRDGGRILNVSSGLTRFALPGYAAYAAMKGAIEVLSRYMAKELGTRGIAVNVVAPGAIETDFGGGAVRDNAQLNRWIADQTALGRVGRPEDIGAVLASLLQPGVGWINAQRIEASGGMLL